jgi:hypothetical protein
MAMASEPTTGPSDNKGSLAVIGSDRALCAAIFDGFSHHS